MDKLKIPKNQIRKLRTFSLGDKLSEFKDSNLQNGTFIDLCSNDYFGLSRDKEVIKKGYEVSLVEGLGAGSSRFITGTRPIHETLEKELAKWINKDKVFLFPSGFQANIAAMQVLADRESIVIADKLIHNSLLTGVKASGAKLVRFLHNNFLDLEKKISKYSLYDCHIVVVIESLYSMEGSIAPIDEITNICKQYKVKLFVDEAHAIGILGPYGKGLTNKISKNVSMISGTFGKSFGSGGAFLACDEDIGNYIIQKSGAFRYTTALSPSLAAGAFKSLEIIKSNPQWGNELLNLSKIWKKRMNEICKFKVTGDCHILSINIGDEDRALKMQKYLEINGFLAIAIRPPTVPKGKSLIRITIRKTLNIDVLEKFISVLENFK